MFALRRTVAVLFLVPSLVRRTSASIRKQAAVPAILCTESPGVLFGNSHIYTAGSAENIVGQTLHMIHGGRCPVQSGRTTEQMPKLHPRSYTGVLNHRPGKPPGQFEKNIPFTAGGGEEKIHLPVDPNPPVPRAVSGSSETISISGRRTGIMSSWAIRSPGSITYSVSLKLCSATRRGPR